MADDASEPSTRQHILTLHRHHGDRGLDFLFKLLLTALNHGLPQRQHRSRDHASVRAHGVRQLLVFCRADAGRDSHLYWSVTHD